MIDRPDPVPPPRRVVLVGSVSAEVVMTVPHLPERGGAARATDAQARAGGGFHVLVAARRAGLEAALAGRVGTGPMAQLVERALMRDGIAVLLPPGRGEQGLTVAFAEPDGVITRVASPGAGSGLTAADLADVHLAHDEVAYLSAQDLLDPTTAHAIASWCGAADGLGAALLVFDPGPMVADVPDDVLDALLVRTDVLAVGMHELELLTGSRMGLARDRALADLADLLAPEAIVLLRLGGARYALHQRGDRTYNFPGDEPGPARLREVAHLLAHLAELRSEHEAAAGRDAPQAGSESVAPGALLATD